jgi:protein-tyrosine phosphatase
MTQTNAQTVLFLCTGNYYRSRFAEVVFNGVAARLGLGWRAASRGLALERGASNVGPMAAEAVERLEALGLHGDDCLRLPAQAVEADFAGAGRIVALDDAEHRPLLEERFPAWAARADYWQVEDAPGVLPRIEREVMALAAGLIGVGQAPEAPSGCGAGVPPAASSEKEQAGRLHHNQRPPVVRVGRETKGRRGKGVTTVFDLPPDDAATRELAAKLKQACGTGGTVKDGVIEIQGDQRERVVAALERLGYQVKRTGG